MPGVIEWQRRIGEQYGRNSGYYTAPLDARAAQEIQALRQENQALRQARQSDAERLAWSEDQLTRVAGDLSDSAAKSAELAGYIDRQNQRFSEQAAAIAEQKAENGQLSTANSQQQAQIERARAETARLKEQVTDKDAANGRLRESVTQLETMIRNLRYTAQNKDAAIRALETAARKALPPAADPGAELAFRDQQQIAAWKDDLIAALTAENLELRALAARLHQRNERLTCLGAGDGTPEPAAISITVDSP
jgi:chromosome segregation ATPase